MSADFFPILFPVIAAAIISISGAIAIRHYAGPAQQAYVSALEGRLRVVGDENKDLSTRVDELARLVKELRDEVDRLEDKVSDLMDENRQLRKETPR
jgi:predicted RNase H-like nuclease (RuvC/YqgF family)